MSYVRVIYELFGSYMLVICELCEIYVRVVMCELCVSYVRVICELCVSYVRVM